MDEPGTGYRLEPAGVAFRPVPLPGQRYAGATGWMETGQMRCLDWPEDRPWE